MNHFAQVIDGVVVQVIGADQAFVDSGAVGDPAQWILTCNQTQAGQHLSGGTPLRKNYAAPGDTYDAQRDAFVPPRPYPSWHLDESTCQWQAPQPYPTTGAWQWNETDQAWQEVVPLL